TAARRGDSGKRQCRPGLAHLLRTARFAAGHYASAAITGQDFVPASTPNKALAAGAALAAVALAGLAYFMRDPERHPPGDPRAILAPADGRVLMVETTSAPAQAFVAGPAWRIVIFLSL